MITGANTNVRYRGILFHVQTEDSGRANPHIISHLYYGGTILGSQKTDYSQHLEADDLLGIVKELIDEQHASMVEQLKSGGYDDVIGQRLGETASQAGLGAAEPDSKPDTRPEEAEFTSASNPTPGPPHAQTETTAEVEVRASAEPARASGERSFGEGSSAKPLDEVILDYLCDKARGRTGANRSEN